MIAPWVGAGTAWVRRGGQVLEEKLGEQNGISPAPWLLSQQSWELNQAQKAVLKNIVRAMKSEHCRGGKVKN